MSYCVGVLLEQGLVLASDSRTNAGVDNIASFRKMTLYEVPKERVIAILCAHSAPAAGLSDVPVFPASCAGNLHTSVVELFVRSGASGVLIACCPPRSRASTRAPRCRAWACPSSPPPCSSPRSSWDPSRRCSAT